MGKFRIEITQVAEKDFAKHFKSGNKSNINTIQKILSELENTPYIMGLLEFAECLPIISLVFILKFSHICRTGMQQML